MSSRERKLDIFMMDLLATVPYYTAYLSRALLQQGTVDVRIGSISYYLDLACFDTRGLKLDPGCMDRVGRSPGLPRALRRAAKLLEMFLNLTVLTARFMIRPPDILHVQFLPMLRSRIPVDLWFVRLVQRRGARVVLTVHDVMPHDTADRFRSKFVNLYRSVDQAICHSTAIQRRLEEEFGVARERIHVIPHGPFFYDLPADDDDTVRRRYGIPADQKLVLWQGIIFPYKGLDVLLDAWVDVEAAFPSVTLVVVGTGSAEMLENVRSQVTRLRLERVVLDLRFTATEELVALYKAASLVVYPYRAITTSGALATGVALGKAVIATDLPVFREMLTDGEDALLVPPLDVSALAAAILRVLREPALQRRLEAAMQAKDFGETSWRSIAVATLEVYREAMEQV